MEIMKPFFYLLRKYLAYLDASAIGALLEIMKDKELIYLKGSLILDLTLYELGNRDVEEVMKLALDLELTFYDASYLYPAKSRDYVKVTDDVDLLEQAASVGASFNLCLVIFR